MGLCGECVCRATIMCRDVCGCICIAGREGVKMWYEEM